MKVPEEAEKLREEGYDVLALDDVPITHHGHFGSIRVVPQEDGGYLLGYKPPDELDYPSGYPPEQGYVTVTAVREDGSVGTYADDIAVDVVELLSEEFENVPTERVQRVLVEVEEPIQVTYFDSDEVIGEAKALDEEESGN